MQTRPEDWREDDDLTNQVKELKALGKQSTIPMNPEDGAKQLERVPNPHPDVRIYYVARFTIPEFTSLCPVTGQPDFATLVIDYAPNAWLVESKSLKLYMFSFRNHGAFHEDCTVRIGRTLAELLDPFWFRIAGFWYPRGGIPIDVFWQSCEPPTKLGLYIPDPGIRTYQPRTPA